MEPPPPAAKKAKPSAPSPAFHGAATASAFKAQTVLKFEANGRFACIVGALAGEDGTESPALLKLTLKAPCGSQDELLAALPSATLQLSSFSGAEYSFYDATLAGAPYAAEVVWPATPRQIARATPSVVTLVEETPAVFASVVAAHQAEQAGRIGWLDSVCSLETERERNLFADKDFIINIDTKWATHSKPTEDPAARAAWRGADFTDGLYLLAISRVPALRSLRDLRGAEGAALCERMRDELRRVARDVYGVSAGSLRIFFHYHPQFYRLHAHCVRAEHVNPGSECERAHLLTTVADNLRRDAAHYAEHATLTYKVRVGERLHGLLRDAGALLE